MEMVLLGTHVLIEKKENDQLQGSTLTVYLLALSDKDLVKCTCPDLKCTSPDLNCAIFKLYKIEH